MLIPGMRRRKASPYYGVVNSNGGLVRRGDRLRTQWDDLVVTKIISNTSFAVRSIRWYDHAWDLLMAMAA